MSKLTKDELAAIEARLREQPAPDLTDPDNPEWTEADFARAQSVDELPADEREAILEAFPNTRRHRGPNKRPAKVATSVRLSRQVLDYYRGTGDGWQSRLNADLEHLVDQRKAGR